MRSRPGVRVRLPRRFWAGKGAKTRKGQGLPRTAQRGQCLWLGSPTRAGGDSLRAHYILQKAQPRSRSLSLPFSPCLYLSPSLLCSGGASAPGPSAL